MNCVPHCSRRDMIYFFRFTAFHLSPSFLASFSAPTTCVWASIVARRTWRGALLPEPWSRLDGTSTYTTAVGREATYALEAARSSSVRDTCQTWNGFSVGKGPGSRNGGILKCHLTAFFFLELGLQVLKSSAKLYLIQNNSHITFTQ